MSNSYDWINSRSRFTDGMDKPAEEPKVDEEISHIVGKKIYAHDKRLLDLVVKFNHKRDPDDLSPSNLLKNPHFLEELKEALK